MQTFHANFRRWYTIFCVLDLKIHNPSVHADFRGFCTQWPSERSVGFLAARLWFDPWDRISHYPLESENPLSSSPNAHQTRQSNLTALSHMGQLHQLQCRALKKKEKKVANFTFCLSGESIHSCDFNIRGNVGYQGPKLRRGPLRDTD